MRLRGDAKFLFRILALMLTVLGLLFAIYLIAIAFFCIMTKPSDWPIEAKKLVSKDHPEQVYDTNKQRPH